MTKADRTANAQTPPGAASDADGTHARWWDVLVDGDVAALDTLLAGQSTRHADARD